MSEAVTRGIRVKVESEFVPERSDPQNGEFFFAYHVTIENHGSETVRLLSRHWIITDGMGKEQEVRGPGVVGKQPRLGHPRLAGLPRQVANPAFSAPLGLLVHLLEDGHGVSVGVAPEIIAASQGYLARVGQWLRESF